MKDNHQARVRIDDSGAVAAIVELIAKKYGWPRRRFSTELSGDRSFATSH
jgi:hypothetical protein